MHGRDQLGQNWPKLYTLKQSANQPAEELVQEHQGADFGWPYCYYDGFQHKLVLAPEYGGDGGKAVGVCAQKEAPVAAFPAHWAPNDMLIYEGSQFPTAYKDGAFIAFHGSWNRAPEPQGGYNVVFQPLADGKASGPFVVFADGFAGAVKQPGQAAHRPTGLAVAPDGSLYIADDQGGRIWHVTFQGEQSERNRRCRAVAIGPAGLDLRQSSAAGGHPSKRRCRRPPDTARLVAGSGGIGRPYFSRTSRRRNLLGMSRHERQRLCNRVRFDRWQMAVGQWQCCRDRADHRPGSPASQEPHRRHAANGRRAIIPSRSRRSSRLRLGHRPPETGIERHPLNSCWTACTSCTGPPQCRTPTSRSALLAGCPAAPAPSSCWSRPFNDPVTTRIDQKMLSETAAEHV